MKDKIANMTAYQIEDLYKQWLKETNRSGSVLVGKSIKEFFEWLKSKDVLTFKIDHKVEWVDGCPQEGYKSRSPYEHSLLFVKPNKL